MDIMKITETFLRQNQMSQEKVGTFKNGKIEKDFKFYHVVQQTYNNRNLLTSSVATYYHKILSRQCLENNVIMICSVVMPTHTHEILYADDIDSISKARGVACRSATFAAKRELKEKGYSVPDRIVEKYPGYIPIKDRCQLLITLKYIADNDAYMRNDGLKAPYSCFSYWKKGYYKSYCVEVLESLFETDMKALISLLESDRKDVIRFADQFNNPEYAIKDEKIFRKQ